MEADQNPSRVYLEDVCDAAYALAWHIKRYWSVDGKPLPEPVSGGLVTADGGRHIAEMLRAVTSQRIDTHPGAVIEWQLRELVICWLKLRAGRLAFDVDFQRCGWLPPPREWQDLGVPDSWIGWQPHVPHALGAVVLAAETITAPFARGVPEFFHAAEVEGLDSAVRTLREAILFFPTPIQEMILATLDATAATGEELLNTLGCGSKETLYGKNRRGGLTELVRIGLVKNERLRGGYYRPDKPPVQKAY